MRRNSRGQHGVGLLEVMLVIVIGVALMLTGLKQYQIYKLGSDSQLIKTNADKIFQAASYYYQMQCRPNRPPPATDANTLAPTVTTDPVVIDIQTDLVDTGLIRDDFAINPLVDNQAAGTWNGYMVQFLRSEEPRLECLQASAPTTTPYSPSCTQTVQIGTIVNWQIQVSVKVRDPRLSGQIANITAADCRTSLDGTGVRNCTDAVTFAQECDGYQATMAANPVGSGAHDAALQDYTDAGCAASGYNSYISFQRSPSLSTERQSQSGLWMSTKRLKEFNQMYQTASIYQILNTSTTPTQYFTCNN